MKLWSLFTLAILLTGCGSGPTPKSAFPLQGTWVYPDTKAKAPVPSFMKFQIRILSDGRCLMGGGMAPVAFGNASLKGSDIEFSTRIPGLSKNAELKRGVLHRE